MGVTTNYTTPIPKVFSTYTLLTHTCFNPLYKCISEFDLHTSLHSVRNEWYPLKKLRKMNIDHTYKTLTLLGHFSKSNVKSMTYKSVIIEWE